MYEILDEDDKLEKEERLMETWKLQTTERIRNFVWVINHNGLFTNSKKNRMGLGSAM